MSRYGLCIDRAPRRDESGQSLVEFAIVLPVLLALIVGIFEFGRAWNVDQVLTNAAREGARRAVLPTATEDDVFEAVEDAMENAALDPDLGSVEIDGLGAGVGTPATVAIEYPYEFALIGPLVGFLGEGDGDAPGTITLSTTVVMRNE